MEIEEALRILSLPADSSWDAIRRAHRAAIVSAHPDAGGSAAAAARVNQALDTLARATDDGRRPLPAPPPPPVPTAPPDRRVRLQDPTEVLFRLADAAHDIGEVVFVDPEAGLLEVIVGEQPGVGQLTASVDAFDGDGVPVAFTLEPLGVTPAPRIDTVVRELMALVRAADATRGGGSVR